MYITIITGESELERYTWGSKGKNMFGKRLFKACGWKWQFLTILNLLSEQKVGTMNLWQLWIHGTEEKRREPTFLIQLMFFQIYPPQYTWVASPVSMQDCSLCMAALGLQLVMAVPSGLVCLTLAQSRRAHFWLTRHFASRQVLVLKVSFLTIGKPMTSGNKTKR